MSYILFLGTKGDVELSTKTHKHNSSILLVHKDTRLLVDLGETFLKEREKILKKYDPTHILFTHAHRDHAHGFECAKLKIYMLRATWNTLDRKVRDCIDLRELLRQEPTRLDDITVEAIPVSHSIKYPANGYIFTIDDVKIAYFPDVLSIVNYTKVLEDVDIYIGDGSFIKEAPGRVRRHKETGRPYGHAKTDDQLRWCGRVYIPTVIFTHFGEQALKIGDEALLKELKEQGLKRNVTDVRIAKDGTRLELKKLGLVKLKPLPGLYLKPPHAKMIAEGIKTLIVKSRKFEKYLNQPVYFIEDDKIYGILTLKKVEEADAAEVKVKRFSEHRISMKEWDKWWPDVKKVYLYTFEVNEVFIPPLKFEVPAGVQTWIREVKLAKLPTLHQRVKKLWDDSLKTVGTTDPFEDDEWLADEVWFGKKTVPTNEHKWLMSISWGPWTIDRQLAVYHKAKENFDKLGKHFHQMTKGDVKKLEYPLAFQRKYVWKICEYLRENNLTFDQLCDKLKEMGGIQAGLMLQDILETPETKLIHVFLRDYLIIDGFPIDRNVERVLKKYGIKPDPYKIITACRFLGINPRVMNRLVYAYSEHLFKGEELEPRVGPQRREAVIESIEMIKDIEKYDPSKLRTEVLADDWRIVCAWYSNKKRGKQIPFTYDQIIDLGTKIVRELTKRGRVFHPKEMKPFARELFQKVKRKLEKEGVEVAVELSRIEEIKSLTDVWLTIPGIWTVGITIVDDEPAICVTGTRGALTEIPDDFHGYKVIKFVQEEPPRIQTPEEIQREAEKESPFAPIYRYGEIKGRLLTLEEVLKSWDKPIVLKSPYIMVCGGLANWGATFGDIDSLIAERDFIKERDQPLIFRLGRALPPDVAHRLSPLFTGEYGGPFTAYVPIYDLVLMPSQQRRLIRLERVREEKAEVEAKKSKEEDKVKPLRFFYPLKGWRGYYHKLEDIKPKVIQEWFAPEDYPIAVQKKYDGARVVFMKQGDRWMIRSDDGEDITRHFPSFIKWGNKNLPHTITFDTEVEMWIDKEHRPREETSGLLRRTEPVDDSNFVPNVFDVVYFYDEKIRHHELRGDIGDLHNEPYELRLRYLRLIDWPQSTDNIPKSGLFNLTPTHICKSPEDVVEKLIELAKKPASEGAVLKSMKSIYELDGMSKFWLKWKIMGEAHIIVLDIKETKKKGIFNLFTGLRIPRGWKVPKEFVVKLDDKEYMYTGKTFNVKGYIKPGTIVALMFHTLMHHIIEPTGEQYVTFYEPKFIGVRPRQTVPDSADEVLKAAEELELVQKKLHIEKAAIHEEAEYFAEQTGMEYWEVEYEHVWE